MKSINSHFTGYICYCSLDMPWDQLRHCVIKLQCQMMAIRSDEFCFLLAVSMLIHMDHDEVITGNKMQSSILDHVAADVNYNK